MKELVDKSGTFLGLSRTNSYKLEDGVRNVLRAIKNYELDVIIAMGEERRHFRIS